MAKRNRQRPTPPRSIVDEIEKAQRDAANEDRRAIVVTIEAQPGETRRAEGPNRPHRRLDVFALMLERKSITGDHERAVRRFQNDVAEFRPLLGSGSMSERVQRVREAEEIHALAYKGAKKRVEAMDRVAAVLAAMGRTEGVLLTALVFPLAAAAPMRWRATVERITGEKHDVGQAARIRAMCQRLGDYYIDLDNAPRRASSTNFIGDMICRAEAA
jgi:hypothetical protein